jgi:hypothetical protein
MMISPFLRTACLLLALGCLATPCGVPAQAQGVPPAAGPQRYGLMADRALRERAKSRVAVEVAQPRRGAILPALDWPKAEIAKLLGVSRQTLYAMRHA